MGYGAIDILKNSWIYDRWWTTEEPAKWGLESDGRDVDVAFYGAYSGSTGPGGITGDPIYCDPRDPPPSMKGKIAVIPTMPHRRPPYDKEYV
jgi:hypothetical protein